jgi:hypothetical protein
MGFTAESGVPIYPLTAAERPAEWRAGLQQTTAGVEETSAVVFGFGGLLLIG